MQVVGGEVVGNEVQVKGAVAGATDVVGKREMEVRSLGIAAVVVVGGGERVEQRGQGG